MAYEEDEREASQIPPPQIREVADVRIVGISVPFWSLVGLLLKLAFAAIPAAIVLSIVLAIVEGVLNGLLR
jgi:hypothetical protein